MNPKRKSVFGWSNVFANYSVHDFFCDAKLPFLVAFILLMVALYNGVDMYEQVKIVLGLGMTIVPSVVALMVAAYAIILSFIMSDKVKEIKASEKGKQFVQNINSSFAMCILISILTIIFMIFSQGISNLEIETYHVYASIINSSVYFTSFFLLTYTVYILIGIVIDIYNSGQTTLL